MRAILDRSSRGCETLCRHRAARHGARRHGGDRRSGDRRSRRDPHRQGRADPDRRLLGAVRRRHRARPRRKARRRDRLQGSRRQGARPSDEAQRRGRSVQRRGRPDRGNQARRRIRRPSIVLGGACSSRRHAGCADPVAAGHHQYLHRVLGACAHRADRKPAYDGFARTCSATASRAMRTPPTCYEVAKAQSVVTVHDGSPYAQQLSAVTANNFNRWAARCCRRRRSRRPMSTCIRC